MRISMLFVAVALAWGSVPDTPDEPQPSLDLEALAEADALDLWSDALDFELHLALAPTDELALTFPVPVDEDAPTQTPVRPAPRAWQPPTA